MEKKRIDPRVQRTRSNLRLALIECMKTHKIENISIQEITDEAKVTRGTFYLHYKDKQEFINNTIADILSEVFKAVIIFEKDHEGNAYPKLSLNDLFVHFQHNQDTFLVLMKEQGYFLFAESLFEKIHQYMFEYVEGHPKNTVNSKVPVDLIITFQISALLGSLVKWAEDGMIYSPHYMAMTYKDMLKGTDNEQVQFLADFYKVN